jgi:putative transposase
MTNHIHLVAVPSTGDGLHRVLKPLHMRYAQRINRARGWKGHLWQGRFFSSPLDEAYLWAAVRYVERNPVRAGMEHCAENYRWSSAAAHCGIRSDSLLNLESDWSKQFSAIDDWSVWLAEGNRTEEIQTLRQNVEKGLPCGNPSFVRRLGDMVGRQLEYRPQGRPRKAENGNLKGSVPPCPCMFRRPRNRPRRAGADARDQARVRPQQHPQSGETVS